MDILYLGPNEGTSGHRLESLRRLKHRVINIDPDKTIPKNRLIYKWNFETGGLFLEKYVQNQISTRIRSNHFDLIFVNGGHLVGPSLVKILQKRYGTVINYNNDNPFENRDSRFWRLYLKSVPLYDLIVVVRETNIKQAYNAGARKVLRVYMSADEIVHTPRALTTQDSILWENQVVFIGTWMPERSVFLSQLLAAGIPLAIYGNRWHKAKQWKVLKTIWKGPAIYGEHYAKTIQSAKICLGLLSKGNRDLHTRRSIEIPALGGLLCAERTSEHLELYDDRQEAMFWSDADECIDICRTLLQDDSRRSEIARRGFQRCFQNGHFNEKVMGNILAEHSTIIT